MHLLAKIIFRVSIALVCGFALWSTSERWEVDRGPFLVALSVTALAIAAAARYSRHEARKRRLWLSFIVPSPIGLLALTSLALLVIDGGSISRVEVFWTATAAALWLFSYTADSFLPGVRPKTTEIKPPNQAVQRTRFARR